MTAAPTTAIDTAKWHLADAATSSKGQKYCILSNENKPVSFALKGDLRTRFGASSFDKNIDSTRKNLDFDISNHKHLIELFSNIDKWAIGYLAKHSQRLLKKQMTEELIKSHYKPLVIEYGDTKSIRTKINIRGHRACRFWDSDRNSTDIPPEDWLSNEYNVHVNIPQLYVMGSDVGFTIETTDLLVRPIEKNCPF